MIFIYYSTSHNMWYVSSFSESRISVIREADSFLVYISETHIVFESLLAISSKKTV